MKVATGHVVSGKIVVDGEAFAEGSTVTVLAPEEGETFDLGAVDEAALLDAIGEADRGDILDGEQFLRDLDNRR